jgi:hypothetical protein
MALGMAYGFRPKANCFTSVCSLSGACCDYRRRSTLALAHEVPTGCQKSGAFRNCH